MKKNLPSLRYEPFITFFETQVTAAQKQLEAMRGTEPLYNAAKLALETHNPNTPARFSPHDTTLRVFVKLGETGHPRDFADAVQAITKELARINLRQEAPPSFNQELWHTCYTWRVSNKNATYRLTLDLSVAYEGNLYCEVQTIPTTKSSLDYKITWHDNPRKDYKLEAKDTLQF